MGGGGYFKIFDGSFSVLKVSREVVREKVSSNESKQTPLSLTSCICFLKIRRDFPTLSDSLLVFIKKPKEKEKAYRLFENFRSLR